MGRTLGRARRVVIKVGTSLLSPPERGVQTRRFSTIAAQCAAAIGDGREIILVCSGAVGLGLRKLARTERPRSIPEKQMAAAIGQIDLCRRFERAFARHGRHIGQILLTHAGLADRERFINARHTIQALLDVGAVPLINENDSVATEELRFGDNDHLSALVSNVVGADLLVLLTDIDGLYDRHPREPGARRIPEIGEVTRAHLASAGSSSSGVGTGGMQTKLEAARTAARKGVPCVIADGRKRSVIERILAGEDIGTFVSASLDRISSRKHWIAYSKKPRGTVHIDAGAARALSERGRSLLPIGVVAVEGRFGVGDLVSCVDAAKCEVARGLSSYSADEIDVIKGQRSLRIEDLLGYSNGDEIIHRDDLVLL